jgi:3D (Asp-Asp-Asp) domain-containing protein
VIVELVSLFAAALPQPPIPAVASGCVTHACWERVRDRRWRRRHPLRFANATAYCLRGRMANGEPVHWGAVAMNALPLGTRIRVERPIAGRRRFTVKDRIGYGTELDVWRSSCAAAIGFGRRTVAYRVIP